MLNPSTTSFYQRCARHLISIYPAAWRERYAEEMLLILEDAPPTFRTLFNLFMSLFDAYLHRHIVQGRIPPMLQKIRSNELVIYASALIFFVAWFVAQRHITIANQPITIVGFFFASASPLVSIVHAVSAILLFLVLLGGLPIVLATGWKALRTRNLRALLFCFLGLAGPFITAFLAIVCISLLEKMIPLHGVTSMWLALLLFFSGLSMSLALIIFAVQSVSPSRGITHYGLYVALCVPVIMLIGLVALLIWTIASFASTFLYNGDGAVFYVFSQGLLFFVMLVTFSFSLTSLKKGFQARKAVQASAQEEAAVM